MSDELALAHIEAERRLRAQTAAAATAAWDRLPTYDEAEVAGFLRLVTPLVLTSQRVSATLTAAYLRRVIPNATVPELGDVVGPAVRAGATLDEVYRRPFVTVWTGLKDGTPWEKAVAAGRERLAATAEIDPQLTMRATARAIFTQTPSVVGYRRVPDPGACPLCLMASTQRYHTGDLLPIHNRCGCGIAPIIGTADPGRVIDPDLLARLKQAKETGVEPKVAEHGELGPVLVNASHDFKTLV